MFTIISMILLLTVVTDSAMANEKCTEQNLKECQNDLEQKLMYQISLMKDGKMDIKSYCQTLENEGHCLKDGYESCKESYPLISDFISALHAYLGQICIDNGQKYLNVAPCLINNKAEFDKCWENHRRKRDADDFHDTCMEVHSLKCAAELSKKLCQDGLEYQNAVQKYLNNIESTVCISSARCLGINIWTFSLILLILYFTKTVLH